MDFRLIKTCTEGERLYLHLVQLGETQLERSHVADRDFSRLTGRDDFAAYMKGAVFVFTFKRILKLAAGINKDATDDTEATRTLLRTLKDWFYWLNNEQAAALARFVSRAHRVSAVDIPLSIRKSIWGSRTLHNCCFCGCALIFGPGATYPRFQ